MKWGWTLVAFCGLLTPGGCLECLECYGLPYNCTERVRECYAHQKACISKAYTYNENGVTTDLLIKGCSQGLACNESAYVNLGTRAMYTSNTCCTSNQCNRGIYYARATVSQVTCKSCLNNSIACSSPTLPTIHCAGVQDLCMSMTTITITQGTRMETVVKGCGTGPLCGRELDYYTGNTTIYSKVECCQSNDCNTGVPRVTENNTRNGLRCYACNDTGKGECNSTRNVLAQLNCTGQMTRCLDIVALRCPMVCADILPPFQCKGTLKTVSCISSLMHSMQYWNNAQVSPAAPI
ncbi:urokinase plasminogen activator surface receptor-like isoform X2 [Ambystoma mexicanum]|uniref:urokinase plasminogen activator surface receptor-like isoform X2 n=1 Tax=Ambystoma mexicanum TaxID=8296 RepID=UPI0037E7AE05